MPIDPARLKDIFTQALARNEPAARAAFLDAACAGDASLRERVEALLRASEDPDSLLDVAGPVLPIDAVPTATFEHAGSSEATADHRPAAGSGTSIAGKYKLLQQIGEGGMGSVWMADQTDPVKRRVAVKLIRADRVASKTIVSRFEAERQAIALMSHPNIAKLLDAGTTEDGSPYFVMELVKGVPLTDYCDAHKLNVPERLYLFQQICSAVHHAHQKGVIHRDLKPTNILVESHDGHPVPKVIDFGLAKATTGMQLTEHTLFTAFGTVAGTPLYMAPEQATFNAIDVDSRADIYALGVILYELLAGSTPIHRETLKTAALDEVLRVIREQEPPPPSSRISTSEAKPVIAANRQSEPVKLGRLVRGELDWVVMRALAKERERRYESATALAADVERFLNQEPVAAGPPSQWYRLRKFVRRNKGRVTAAALVLFVLVAGIVGTTLGLLWAIDAERFARGQEAKANTERERADEETNKVRTAQDAQQNSQYLSDMQLMPLAYEKGTMLEVRRLLDRHVPEPGAIDRRGYEWHYWERQLNLQARTAQLRRCEDSIYSVWAVSDDGSRVAQLLPPARGDVGASPILTVWDTTTCELLCRYVMPIKLPPNVPTGLAPTNSEPRFSPDGRRVDVTWVYGGFTPRQPGEIVGPGGGPMGVRIHGGIRQIVDVSTGRSLLDIPDDERYSMGFFSRDGRRFALIGTRAGEIQFERFGRLGIRVWDLEAGKELTNPISSAVFNVLAFSPDGNTFLTAKYGPPPVLGAAVGGVVLFPDYRISVRDVSTGKEVAGWLIAAETLDNLTVSPDGTVIAAANRGGQSGNVPVSIWKASTGELLTPWTPDGMTYVNSINFSPDGTKLEVRGAGDDIRSIDGAFGFSRSLDLKTMKPLPRPESSTDLAFVNRWRLSPDGIRAVAVDTRHSLQVWDAASGRLQRTIRGAVNPVVAYGFSRDSRRVWAVERGGLFKEWNLDSSGPVAIPFLGIDTYAAGEFALCGDGGRFAQLICAGDPRNGPAEFTVQMRTADGREWKLLKPTPRGVVSREFQYHSNCGLFLSGDGRRAALTRIEARAIKFGEPMPGKHHNAMLPAPDLTAWDTETGKELLHIQLKGSRLIIARPTGGHVGGISANGRVVAVGLESADERDPVSIGAFDIEAGAERRSIQVPGAVDLLTISVSPDGTSLAAVAVYAEKASLQLVAKLLIWGAGADPSVVVELPGGTRPVIGKMPYALRARVAWSPDGSRFLFSYRTRQHADFTVREAATGRVHLTPELPDTSIPQLPTVPLTLAWNPDGKRFAGYFVQTGPGRSPEVKVWDAANGKEMVTLRQPSDGSGRVNSLRPDEMCVAFSADGHCLLLGEFGTSSKFPAAPGLTEPNAYLITTWDATPVLQRDPKQP